MKTRTLPTTLAILLLSLCQLSFGNEGLRVATFSVDITPPLSQPVGQGFIPILETAEHPLLARGIIFKDEGQSCVVCTLDLMEVHNDSYDFLRQAISEVAGVPASHVALQALHQHTAPAIDAAAHRFEFEEDHPRRVATADYVVDVAKKLTDAIRGSQERWQRVTHIGTAKAKVERVASNRRIEREDGSIQTRGSNTKSSPELRKLVEGRIDPWVRTVSLHDGDREVAYLYYYASHPQSFYGDGRASYDVPGIIRQRLEKKTGAFQLYLTGCGGDVAFGKYNDGSLQARDELTDRLQAGIEQSIADIVHMPVELIDWSVAPITFPPRTDAPFGAAANRRTLADPKSNATQRRKAAIALAWIKRRQAEPVELSCLSIGRVKMLHLPGEPFVQYQLAAQKMRPDRFVCVAGYGDCGMGYIGGDRIYTDRGGYEQTYAFAGPCEELLLTTIKGLLDSDSTEERPSVPLRPMLAINEDNGHFFGYKNSEEMNVCGLHAWVDQYAGGAVTHLFICPNAMRASFRSKSRDAIWDPFDGKVPDHPWPRNAQRLHDAGIDPYKVWIARCREKKISPWLSMRMNDVHNTEDRDNFQHSTFWRKNIHLWREPDHPHGSGLNYANAEVREYQMAFVRELLERYDSDGLELDWMRFPNHLTPGKAREEGRFLTEFVREVRALTDEWSKKRGHRILLGVRAPALPDAGAGTGMNAVEWARLGLVDLIVATPFYFSTDFDIPFELWHERLKDAPNPVTVIGGVESTARPWISGTPVGNTMETLRGFAASSYHRGARGVYLFNWMDDTNWPVPTSDYKLLLHDGVGPKVAARGSRRYPVCFHDTVAEGSSRDEQLPADARTGKTFRIHIGPNPKSGRVWAIAGMAKRSGLAEARFEAKLNGHILEAVEDVANTKTFGGDVARAIRFACPVNVVKAGYNELALRQAAGSTGQQIVWVELRVEGTGKMTP